MALEPKLGLIEKRSDLLSKFRMLEEMKVGYSDPNSPTGYKALGQLPLSERPVAFSSKESFTFVGPCAAKALVGLRKYVAEIKPLEEECITDGGEFDPHQSKALRATEALLARINGRGDPETLIVPRSTWNSIAFALLYMGVQINGTDA